MRRIVWLVFAVFCLTLATSVVAKPKAVKVKKISQTLQIKRAVLNWQGQQGRGPKTVIPLKSVRFGPIKIADGWAMTTYVPLDSHGREIEGDGCQYLLRYIKGHWQMVRQYFEGNIEPKIAKKLGLPKATAKKLGITLESFD